MKNKPNTNDFATDFSHRLNAELDANPTRLHDCLNPVLERAAVIAEITDMQALLAARLGENKMNQHIEDAGFTVFPDVNLGELVDSIFPDVDLDGLAKSFLEPEIAKGASHE